MTTPKQWADAFLSYLGYTITPTNEAEVVAWEERESGGVGSYNNPLNTTLKMPGSWGVNFNNGQPVQGYPTMMEGIQADAMALQGSFRNYAKIRADLQSGNTPPQQFGADVGGSPWGTPYDASFQRLLGSGPIPVAPGNDIPGGAGTGGSLAQIGNAAANLSPSSIAGQVSAGIANAATSIFRPLKTPFENMAVRVALVAFGAIAIIVGIATLAHDAGTMPDPSDSSSSSGSSIGSIGDSTKSRKSSGAVTSDLKETSEGVAEAI